MKKRIILLLLCVLTLAVSLCLFTGCDDGETPDNGGGTTDGGTTDGGTTDGGTTEGGSTEGGITEGGGTGGGEAPSTINLELKFEKNLDGSSYFVTGYTGIGNTVVIPHIYDGLSVAGINSNAFKNNTALSSVTIPNTVKTIGASAFEGCVSLSEITIPDSVTSIGASAFSKSGLTSITIPYSVETLGDSAFYNCPALKTASFAEGSKLERIGASTFANCVSLSKVNYGERLNTFGAASFSGCKSLSDITLPNNTTTIESFAFFECSGAKNITIPKAVTNIGHYAFYGCTMLTEINFNATNCSALLYDSYVFCGAGANSTGITVKLGDNASAPSYLFRTTNSSYVAPNIKSVVLGNNTKLAPLSIEWSKINLTFAENVTSIAASAFSGCTELTSITIPNSVTSIGASAFSGCTELTSITIPNSVTSISFDAFKDCSKLTGINVSEANTIYKSIDGNLYSKDGKTLIRYIRGKTATSFTIPDSVTSISSYAFEDCDSLKSVTIPNSVTSIGSSAFSGCSKLEKITIPFVGGSKTATSASSSTLFGYIFGTSSYTGGTSTKQYYSLSSSSTYYIPSTLKSVTVTDGNLLYGAFYNCDSLTSVTIGNGVTSIGSYAFYSCSSLMSVVIGNSVTSIGNYAFQTCYKLVEVINKSSLNITKGSYDNGEIGSYALEIHNGESKIVNKDGYLFYTLNGVNYLVNYVGTDTALTLPSDYNGQKYVINKNAFCNNDKITSVIIPDSVTSIGERAFEDCDSLTSVVIGNSVTSIGDYAFAYCSSLKSIKYRGSSTQWNAISKGSDWNYNTGNYTMTYNYTGE